jgi:hypothetical protein
MARGGRRCQSDVCYVWEVGDAGFDDGGLFVSCRCWRRILDDQRGRIEWRRRYTLNNAAHSQLLVYVSKISIIVVETKEDIFIASVRNVIIDVNVVLSIPKRRTKGKTPNVCVDEQE